MKIIRSVFLIINYKTFVVTFLSIITTYVCHHFNYTADFPLALVSIAIVFPIVFSINSAYQRREKALTQLANIKGHALAMYLASRDWLTEGTLEDQRNILDQIRNLLLRIQEFLMSDIEHSEKEEKRVLETFSAISTTIKSFRKLGLPSGEASRFNQYLSKMMISFEDMKVIYQYRTPITLRAYSKGFIYTFPILFAPFFASTFDHYSPGLGYMMPILYSFILVSLDNIQDHLEDPYDQVGEDDIKIQPLLFTQLIEEGMMPTEATATLSE